MFRSLLLNLCVLRIKTFKLKAVFTNYLPFLTINVVAAKLMIEMQRKTDVSLLIVLKHPSDLNA